MAAVVDDGDDVHDCVTVPLRVTLCDGVGGCDGVVELSMVLDREWLLESEPDTLADTVHVAVGDVDVVGVAVVVADCDVVSVALGVGEGDGDGDGHTALPGTEYWPGGHTPEQLDVVRPGTAPY